jgi:acyl-CoA thioesterase-1
MALPLRTLLLTVAFVFTSVVEAASFNIVAIGASNTWGWGVASQNAYPAQLQALLRKRGINANVTSAGIPLDTTAGMLGRLDADVPKGTDVVILQPDLNDLRFFGTRGRRAANIAAMMKKLRARGIRVIVYDPKKIPKDFYQWDGLHYTSTAHAEIAATIASQFAGAAKVNLATKTTAYPAAKSKP